MIQEQATADPQEIEKSELSLDEQLQEQLAQEKDKFYACLLNLKIIKTNC